MPSVQVPALPASLLLVEEALLEVPLGAQHLEPVELPPAVLLELPGRPLRPLGERRELGASARSAQEADPSPVWDLAPRGS